MRKILAFFALLSGIFSLFITSAPAATQYYRLILTEMPTTSMRIGWALIGGCPDTQRIYYDTIDHGQDTSAYAFQASFTASFFHQDMENYFCQLEGLQPDTRYYFVIAEDQGISPRMWFTTFPNTRAVHPWKAYWCSPDSIETTLPRKQIYQQISHRPVDFVLIDGLSRLQTDEGWRQWFQDWQSSIPKNGQMVPIVIAGNITADIQYLFNLSSEPIHTYPLTSESALITIADKRMPGKRFWKKTPSDIFTLLHTSVSNRALPPQADVALFSSFAEAALPPNTFEFPTDFPFVEMIWEEGRLRMQSPQQKTLWEVYATP
ncbi:MAG: fibronectin type III domain-containing protein [Cyclobacteriaceae bacterium]